MPQHPPPDPFSHLLDDAVSEVFDLMLSFPCTPALPSASRPPGFTASVQFSGSLTGSCAVHLDVASANLLTTHLTGQPPEPDSPLLADIVGELCNMIAGSWKSRLAPPLASCHLSPPTIAATVSPALYNRAYQFDQHYLNLELILT